MSTLAARLSASKPTWVAEPGPMLASVRLPGRCRAASSNALSVRYDEAALTANAVGALTSWQIGTRSASGSKLSLRRFALTTRGLALISRVSPSGAARETASLPMSPAAPGRVSIRNVWPCLRPISSATRRARRSLTPPGGFGTTNLIGLCVCDQAMLEVAAAIARARIAIARLRTRVVIVTMHWLRYFCDHTLGLDRDYIRDLHNDGGVF